MQSTKNLLGKTTRLFIALTILSVSYLQSFAQEESDIITIQTKLPVGSEFDIDITPYEDTPKFDIQGVSGNLDDGYKLTSQTVTIKGRIKELICNKREITHLDLSKAKRLSKLDCRGNLLTELNTSAVQDLQWFACNDNSISSLEL